MARNYTIGGSRKDAPSEEDFIDAAEPAQAAPAEPIKRMSLEFPESVHMRLKIGAAMRKLSMLDTVIEMIRARFMGAPWPDDVVAQVKAQIGYVEPAQEEPAASAPAKPRRRRATTKQAAEQQGA